MDEFKLRNFTRSHPGVPPPRLERLAEADARLIRARIRDAAGLPAGSTDLELTRRIADEATPISNADPTASGFDLEHLLSSLGIQVVGRAHLNWGRYDDIDRVSFVDLSRYFSDIWYPDSDDIEVFDESFSWILVVPHSGVVRLAVLRA